MGVTKRQRRRAVQEEVASVALEALATAQAHRRPPSRQDVIDSVNVERAGKPCGKRVQATLTQYGWALTLRLWWRQECLPEGASVCPTQRSDYADGAAVNSTMNNE
jgi:hypothetical protein